MTEPHHPPNAIISLHRSPQLTASLTKFDVFIDGKKVGRLSNNERESYPVPPGDHTIHVAVDDYPSKKVTISLRPGENVRLTCWAKAFGLGVVIGFE
jgi:hypothetical protein